MNTEKNYTGYNYNDTLNACFIYPNLNFPNGLYLNYTLCPEEYSSSRKLVGACCLQIVGKIGQKGLYNWLIYYASSSILIPAILFNIISFIVLCRYSKLNRNNNPKDPVNFYLKCFCIFNTLTIISKSMNEFFFVKNVIREKAIKINLRACQIVHFFESTCVLSTSYILILLTINVLMGICYPLEMKTEAFALFRPKWDKFKISVVLVLSIAYSFFYIYNIKYYIKTSPNVIHCSSNSYDKNLEYIDSYIKILFPVVLLCVFHIMIFIILIKSKKGVSLEEDIPLTNLKKAKRDTKRSNKASASQIVIKDTNKKRESSCFNDFILKIGLNEIKSCYSARQLAISFGIIVLNLPYFIVVIYEINFNERKNLKNYANGQYLDKNNQSISFTKNDILKNNRFELFNYFSIFLFDLNYIASFFFYFFSGDTFRSRLFAIFKTKTLRRK